MTKRSKFLLNYFQNIFQRNSFSSNCLLITRCPGGFSVEFLFFYFLFFSFFFRPVQWLLPYPSSSGFNAIKHLTILAFTTIKSQSQVLNNGIKVKLGIVTLKQLLLQPSYYCKYWNSLKKLVCLIWLRWKR